MVDDPKKTEPGRRYRKQAEPRKEEQALPPETEKPRDEEALKDKLELYKAGKKLGRWLKKTLGDEWPELTAADMMKELKQAERRLNEERRRGGKHLAGVTVLDIVEAYLAKGHFSTNRGKDVLAHNALEFLLRDADTGTELPDHAAQIMEDIELREPLASSIPPSNAILAELLEQHGIETLSPPPEEDAPAKRAAPAAPAGQQTTVERMKRGTSTPAEAPSAAPARREHDTLSEKPSIGPASVSPSEALLREEEQAVLAKLRELGGTIPAIESSQPAPPVTHSKSAPPPLVSDHIPDGAIEPDSGGGTFEMGEPSSKPPRRSDPPPR